MSVEANLISAFIAIATGVVVVMLVHFANWLRARRRRQHAIGFLRSTIIAFREEMEGAPALEGTAITRDQTRFAMLEEHIDMMRGALFVASHDLHRNEYTSLLRHIDGHGRLIRMIKSVQTVPGPERQFFDTYFEGLRKIAWLDFS